MDRITKSLLDEFVAEHGLCELPEDRAFEHFASHLAVSSHHGESFSTDDICVGAGGDCGIDGIAFIVNGRLVTEPEEVEDLSSGCNYLDATLVFVQAERSSSFDTSKIGQFGFGVRDFFVAQPSLVRNDRVNFAARIMNAIYDRSGRFKKGNPLCLLFYFTTGRWTDDRNLLARREAVRRDLDNLNLFRAVKFECIGADRIQQLYRQARNALKTEILFADRTVLPEVPRVEQAYVGVLPAIEYLKLVENDAGEMLGSLFYDNVRDWQEWNAVNKGMRATLESDTDRKYFPLLNNGITIVAREVIPTGNRFVIEDYQIVNGCQTSHVLHEVRDCLTSDVYVPIRLIATDDAEIRNAIITATNRQTEVPDDQLVALSDFPKKLEAYFPTFEGKKRLYYERRSRQYGASADVVKVRVVDMRTLVRAFVAMFLGLPHRTTRDYRALLRNVGTDIFNKDHRLEPYYTAAYAHYRLESMFRNQSVPPELKPARYHLLYAFRLQVAGLRVPSLASGKIVQFCDALTEALWDDDESRRLFDEAVEHVRAVAAGPLDRDNIRTETFTESLLARLRPVAPAQASP